MALYPMAGLVMWSNHLFGTTFEGGSNKRGTVFCINTDGTNFFVLNHFDGTNGRTPYVGLTYAADILYGDTAAGGISNRGTIFRVNPDGGGFDVIKSFLPGEGSLLMSPLIVTNQTIYGTTLSGGVSNSGTIFSVGTNGDGFTVLKTFAAGDGSQPRFGLVFDGKSLFGVTDGYGVNDDSLIYRINTDGNSYTVIKRFSEPDPVTGTNADGSYLQSGMALWNGVLYGATSWGGFYGNGVIFKLNLDGSGFAVLKQFPAFTNNGYVNSAGAYPYGDLMVANGVLYGVTRYGGNYGNGVLFSLNIPPPPTLQITNHAGQTVIYWSDDGLNRSLQTTTDIASGKWTAINSLNWTNTGGRSKQIGLQISNPTSSSNTFFKLQ